MRKRNPEVQNNNMMTIRILTLFVVGMSVLFEAEGTTSRPIASCKNSKEKGYLVANCHGDQGQKLESIPGNIMPEVQLLKLQDNRISKLTNSSFVIYPKIKELLLSDNVVHTIESGALTVLDELELLDLSGNALQEAPVGLPASLVHLNLNKNPVKHMERLSRAVGLQVLKLSNCDLGQYPALGVMPNLVELDVSNNELLDDLDPVKLAATCRLTRLDVTGCTALFQGPESRCRCLRVVEWTQTYKIRVLGMPPCPAADDGGDADNCTATAATDEARAVFKNCMVEWEHRNTPYWAIGLGLVIAVAVLLALCVCLRRRKRRHHTDKVQSVPATDTKENNDSTATGNKSEPAALLSSP